MWQYKCTSEFLLNCVMLHFTEMASFLNFGAVSGNVYVIGMYITGNNRCTFMSCAGSLFYVKTVICQFMLLIHHVCGQLVDMGALIWYIS